MITTNTQHSLLAVKLKVLPPISGRIRTVKGFVCARVTQYAALCLVAGAEAGVAQIRCPLTEWTVPRAIKTDAGVLAYVESPAILPSANGITLVGSPTLEWGAKVERSGTRDTIRLAGAIEHPWIGVYAGQTLQGIPRPLGANVTRNPVTVPLRDHAVVFWSEAGDSTVSPTLIASEIWTATLTSAGVRGRTLALGAQEIRWGRGMAGSALVGGDPAFAAAASDRNPQSRHQGIVFVRGRGVTWKTTWIDFAGMPPTYVTMAASGNHAVVAFIGSVEARVSATQGVFVVESTDGGATWTAPSAVHVFANGEYSGAPRLTLESSGRMSLFWGVRYEPRSTFERIAIASFDPGARSWTIDSPLSFADGSNVLDVLLGPGNVPWVLTRSSPGHTLRISRRDQPGSTWETGVLPLGHIAASVPTMAFLDSNRLLVAVGVPFGPSEIGGLILPQPVLMTMEHTLSCAPR
ncbi:MAG: hypothetical protein V4550_00175 [Gemmatimonadota bacterium]